MPNDCVSIFRVQEAPVAGSEAVGDWATRANERTCALAKKVVRTKNKLRKEKNHYQNKLAVVGGA